MGGILFVIVPSQKTGNMIIKQLYTSSLGAAAYFIESNGEAAVIDPLRDIDVYTDLAREHEAQIKYIFETHLHADFVSGHIDLQRATGAPIVYGPNAETRYPIHKAMDNESFRIGDVEIVAISTPGHTIESTCYLLKDEQGKPHALFSGDTLLVNEIGRPDAGSNNNSIEELATSLYDSIHNKIMTLPDDVIIYPAHGHGNSIGVQVGKESFTTIGEQKEQNKALTNRDIASFIEEVTSAVKSYPSYFEWNTRMNKQGYESLNSIMDKSITALGIGQFKEAMANEENILIDTRSTLDFTEGFIPGSVYMGLTGRMEEWAGTLLSAEKSLLLITEPGQEKETIKRLSRVGFTKFTGYLDGGFSTWKNAVEPVDMIINVEADELAMDIPFDEHLVVVDVRRETEFGNAHVKQAVNIPLEELNDPASMANLEDDQNLYIHCASGYRSVIAASLLKKQGIHNLRNVLGGFNSIQDEKRIEIVKEDSVLN